MSRIRPGPPPEKDRQPPAGLYGTTTTTTTSSAASSSSSLLSAAAAAVAVSSSPLDVPIFPSPSASSSSQPLCQPHLPPPTVPGIRTPLQKASANRMKQRLQRPHNLPMDHPASHIGSYPSAPASPPTPAPSPTPTRQLDDWSSHLSANQVSVRTVFDLFSTLGDSSRKALLGDLLDLCTISQLAYINNVIAPRLRRDPFSVLPDELCLRVLSYVDDPRTLAQASQVNTRWRNILADDFTWKNLCERHNYAVPSASASAWNQPALASQELVAFSVDGRLRSAGIMPLDSSAPAPAPSSSSSPSSSSAASSSSSSSLALPPPLVDPWFRKLEQMSYRSQYRHRYSVDVAWRSGGRCQLVHRTANTVVATGVQVTDQYIIVTRDNARIHVFSLDGTELREFEGHSNGVWAMDILGDILVTGGCDREIRAWNLHSGDTLQVMNGHTSTVRCLRIVDQHTAVSGSRDASVRVWDLKTGACRFVLLGHQASVRCLDVHGDNVASGAYDNTARLWNVREGVMLCEFEGHSNHIYAIIYNGECVITGSLDTTIRVWNPVTGDCTRILQGHTSLVGHLQLRGSTLVSGGSDGSVRVWSMDTFEAVVRIAAHDNSVISLQFDDTRIVSGGSDGRVKVWDIKTGVLVRELGPPSTSIWRVAFTPEHAVILANRREHTVMEVWSFSPDPDYSATPAVPMFRSTGQWSGSPLSPIHC